FFIIWCKLTFVEIMYLQAYFWIMILLFEIPCGAISDYLGRKYSLFLAGITTAAGAAIYSITPHIGMFILAETLWAFGEALFSGTNTAIIHDTLKMEGREKELDKIVARSISFLLIGIGIAAPIGSLLTLIIPIQFVMMLMSIPFVMGGCVALTLKEPKHDLENNVKRSESYISIIKSGMKELKQKKQLRILAFDQMIGEGLIFTVFWTFQPYLEEFGFLLAYFGFVSTLMIISQLLFVNLVPKLNDKISNKKRFLFVFTMIPGIGFFLLAVLRLVFCVILLFMIIVGFGISRSFIYVNSINKHIESNNRATVLSTISMIGTCIKAIVFPLSGYVVMVSLSGTFIVLGIVMILLAIFSQVEIGHLT
ncbi:MAG: MFS transporter, partial [Promethearchaeota archaeon]